MGMPRGETGRNAGIGVIYVHSLRALEAACAFIARPKTDLAHRAIPSGIDEEHRDLARDDRPPGADKIVGSRAPKIALRRPR